jgi:glycine oxidase
VKSWDVIVLGCGVIGASLARELHKSGASVLVVERGEPGREASHAAAGMLAPHGGDLPRELSELAVASAAMYPEFARELDDETATRPHKPHPVPIDLRSHGTILIGEEIKGIPGAQGLDPDTLAKLEPQIASSGRHAAFIQESSVDPRGLMAALVRSLKHREIDVAHGMAATQIVRVGSGGFEVHTAKAKYLGRMVVNCCGAWAGEIAGVGTLPAIPRKGQMFSVIPREPGLLKHVIRSEEVYLVPRSDGRILIGATVEDVGFDKQVNPDTIKEMGKLAEQIVPEIAHAKFGESWAGLRPGTPDDLPILGETKVPGYFVATGHFRNGVLLAPVTAVIMSKLVRGEAPGYALGPFRPSRFA